MSKCKICAWGRMEINPCDHSYQWNCTYPAKKYPDEIGISEYVRRENNFIKVCME